MKNLKEYIIEAKSKKVQPKTKSELVSLIEAEVEKNGWNCDLNHIDTSKITDMSDLFSIDDACFGLGEFNGDISKWNVTNVEYMTAMFWGSYFNGDISKWNVRKVKDMESMFYKSAFNGDISKWQINKNCSVSSMFDDCQIKEEYKPEYFKHKSKYQPKTKDELVSLIKDEVKKNGWNCDLNHIDTSKITDMSELFGFTYFDVGYDLHIFNGDISGWDVSNVKSMKWMFVCSDFNGDISKWNVSNVEDMCSMFASSKFNKDISNWNVSKVTNMREMFCGAKSFNQDLSKWNVRKVINMDKIFCNTKFNGDISKWDVSSVTNMCGMFSNTNFNKDISKWDISNVNDMRWMFYGSKFNKDISNWKIKTICNKDEMFGNCPIKEEYKPGYIKPTPEKQSKLEIELNSAINRNDITKTQNIIKNILLKNGKKSNNYYSIYLKYDGRCWNTRPYRLKYDKSKDKIYIDLYWQGDLTDGDEIFELSQVLFKDFNFYVHTKERMLSEKSVILDYLKQFVKEYNS